MNQKTKIQVGFKSYAFMYHIYTLFNCLVHSWLNYILIWATMVRFSLVFFLIHILLSLISCKDVFILFCSFTSKLQAASNQTLLLGSVMEKVSITIMRDKKVHSILSLKKKCLVNIKSLLHLNIIIFFGRRL